MLRQAVFGAWVSIALIPLSGQNFAFQDKNAAATNRPPAEIPLARLKPDATLAVPFEPGATASADAVWVMDRAAGAIVRIGASDNTAGAPIAVGGQPCASLVVAFDGVWVPLCGGGTMARVDAKEGKVLSSARVAVADPGGSIAAGVGSIWAITDRQGVLARVDPDTGAAVAEVYLPKGTVAVASGTDALWITSADAGRLTRVNPHNTEVVEEIAVGPKPRRLAIGEGAVWVLNGDGSVSRVDPATNKVVATIQLGGDTSAGDITAGAGAVWVSLPGAPIVRLDPRTNRATQKFTGDGGGAILVAHGSIWVSAGPRTTWRLDPRLVEAVRP